jgi:hypothetical protein
MEPGVLMWPEAKELLEPLGCASCSPAPTVDRSSGPLDPVHSRRPQAEQLQRPLGCATNSPPQPLAVLIDYRSRCITRGPGPSGFKGLFTWRYDVQMRGLVSDQDTLRLFVNAHLEVI